MTPFEQTLRDAVRRQSARSEAAPEPRRAEVEERVTAFEARMAASVEEPEHRAPTEPWAVELGVRVWPCDADELKRAFRRRAFETHPDRVGGSHEAFLRTQRLYAEGLRALASKPRATPVGATRYAARPAGPATTTSYAA